MRRVRLLHGVAFLLLTAGPALAQEAGGIGFPAGGVSSANLAQAFAQPARQPVFANAARRGAPPGAMVTNPAKSRKEFHQELIAKTRGDAGFLAGFQKGQPLAASRNPLPELQPMTFIDAPFIVNNVDSSLNIAFGEGNSASQGVATSVGGDILGDGTPGGGTSGDPAASQHRRHRHRGEQAQTPAIPTVPAANTPAIEPTRKVQLPGTSPGTAVKMPEMPPATTQSDALMTTLGPLPYLPSAMKNNGVRFNNTNSVVNIAAGTGNVAGQKVKTIQR